MGKHINTYKGGLDKDSSVNKYTNTHYFDLENFRLITDDGQSSGALENVKGNKLCISFQTTPINLTGIIVGHVVVRDILILLCQDLNTANNNYIFRININDIDVNVPIELSVSNLANPAASDYYHNNSNKHLIYADTGLNFLLANKMSVVGRYENDNIIKIYFTDGVEPLRMLNIINNDISNPLETLSIDKLSIIPNINITTPAIINTTGGGSLKSGVIQYAYQLYNLNGTETRFSQTSNLFHLVKESENLSDTRGYIGSVLGENTNKTLIGEIDIDSTGYSMIRIISIHYPEYNATPLINIISEKNISSSTSTIQFTDTGDSIGTMTLEELLIFGTFNFSAKSIETKDNILFASNITTNSFSDTNIDEWDARSYRFNSVGASLIWAESAINGGYLSSEKAFIAADLPGAYPSNTDGAEQYYDCFNSYNDHNATSNLFMYQSNGSTIGGSGPNINYRMKLETRVLDSDYSDTNIQVYQNTYTAHNNPSYKNYASPYIDSELKGYQRGEIYRFGIIFIDGKGRESFAKWIGDIRMPKMYDETDIETSAKMSAIKSVVNYGKFPTFIDSGIDIYMNILKVEFSVSGIPIDPITGVEYKWRIVRLERTENDKTVISQGVISRTLENLNFLSSYGTHYLPDCYNSLDTTISTDINPFFKILSFESPEISFNKSLYSSSDDYIEAQLILPSSTETKMLNAPSVKYKTYKYKTSVDITTTACKWKKSLLDSVLTYPDYGNTNILISYGTYAEYNELSGYKFRNHSISSGVSSPVAGAGSTKLFLDISNDELTSAEMVDLPSINSTYIVNYNRNNFQSIYNGVSYENRALNEYIPCGDIEDGNSTSHVFGGDTYINYFDFHKVFWDENWTEPQRISGVYYIPLETTINMDLRYDDCHSRKESLSTIYAQQEEAGIYVGDGSDSDYVQTKDLYSYNKVYSKENNTNKYIQKPVNWNEQIEFDVRTIASRTKINNEISDSWVDFPVDQFNEVDSTYGEITRIININNKLIFFQENAVGIQSVNQRELQSSNIAGVLALGFSGLLDRFDYISTTTGVSNKEHIIKTNNGLYWIDVKRKACFKMGNKEEELSLVKGMDSWFNDNIDENTEIFSYFDPKFKDVLFRFKNGSNYTTLVFNELLNVFTGFYDLGLTQHAIIYNDVLITNNGEFKHLYMHNEGERGLYYWRSGDKVYKDSKITILANPNAGIVNTFNNIEYLMETTNVSNVNLSETFDSIRVYNDYQDTGVIPLTENINIKRRLRTWRAQIPRATLDESGNTLDRIDARIRDSYIKIELVYNNNSDKRVIIHDIITSFTQSSI